MGHEIIENPETSPMGHPIIYSGKPRKTLAGLVQPLIVATKVKFGPDYDLEVIRGKKSMLFDGLGADIVTPFRQLSLIESGWNPSLEDRDYFRDITYVEWDLEMNDRDNRRHRIINYFGRENFDLMRTVQIPEGLLDTALGLKAKNLDFRTVEFTEAVKLGQLSWEKHISKLEALGVENPQKYAQFEDALKIYANLSDCPRYCLVMWQIEAGIEKAINFFDGKLQKIDLGKIFALALVYGNITTNSFARGISSDFANTPNNYDPQDDFQRELSLAVAFVNQHTNFDKIKPDFLPIGFLSEPSDQT